MPQGQISKIKFLVEFGDVLSYRSDVLALKYSQAIYPLDQEVLKRFAGIEVNLRAHLPKNSEYYFSKSHNIFGANSILLVGVGYQFDYKQLRDFAYKAITSLASVAPETRHISLTHYGVAYGLDETESFKSEVAGLIDGIASGNFPRQLERVTFVMNDESKARRLNTVLSELLPDGFAPSNKGVYEETPDLSVIDDLRSVGYSSADKPHIFVAMPFSEDMNDIFHYGIQGAVNAAGFLCERADLSSFTGDIMTWVKDRIASSHLVIADLSTANPNVYLEIGYAWGCRIPTILLVRNSAELKFDVRGQRCLVYKSIKNLEELLHKELVGLKSALEHDSRRANT